MPTISTRPFKAIPQTVSCQQTHYLVIGLDMRPGAPPVGLGHAVPGLDALIEAALQVANAIGLTTNEGCHAAVPERAQAAGMVDARIRQEPGCLAVSRRSEPCTQESLPEDASIEAGPEGARRFDTLTNGGAIERSIGAAVPMHGAPGTAALDHAAAGTSDTSTTEILAAKVPPTFEHQTYSMLKSMQQHRSGRGKRTFRPSRVRRRIANSTCLRVLFVTSGMFETLLPDLGLQGEEHGYALSESMDQGLEKSVQHGGTASSSIESQSYGDGFHCHQSAVKKLDNKVAGRPQINTTILINDSNKRQWSVAFVSQDKYNQYHRRLCTGWADFCEANDVRIGDAVEFRRLPGRIITLHACVLRGNRWCRS